MMKFLCFFFAIFCPLYIHWIAAVAFVLPKKCPLVVQIGIIVVAAEGDGRFLGTLFCFSELHTIFSMCSHARIA